MIRQSVLPSIGAAAVASIDLGAVLSTDIGGKERVRGAIVHGGEGRVRRKRAANFVALGFRV